MDSKRFSAWGDLVGLALVFLIALLIVSVCAGVVMLITGDLDLLSREKAVFAVYTAQFTLAIVLGVVWLRRRGGARLRFGIGWRDAPLILGGVILMTAAGIVIEPLINLFPDHYLETLNDAIGSGGWAILTTVVAAPILEEIFFRGLVLERLSKRWCAPAAVGASALLFGLAHAPILPQMVSAVLVAVVWGYIYLMTRSLIPMIAMHAINNGIAYIQLQILGTQATDTRAMIGNDAAYWAVYAVSGLILVGSIVFMARKTRTKPGEISLDKKTADGETL